MAKALITDNEALLPKTKAHIEAINESYLCLWR